MHKIPMNRLILRKLDFHTKNDTKKKGNKYKHFLTKFLPLQV